VWVERGGVGDERWCGVVRGGVGGERWCGS
jgi:hypothetical protein